jgi:glycine/D-amino acid oxidase-like deaminating enzyme
MKKRWPQINFEGIQWGIFEPECGYLDARASCQAVVEAFVAAGGKYRQVAVLGDGIENGTQRALSLSDGAPLKADAYVFACGPWLGKLFPQTIGDLVQPTKQDVFFFGTPPGDDRFRDAHLPVWADHRGRFRYGIPGSGRRGFKIADDTRGPAFDPTNGERVVNQETLKDIREYVGFRFPALKNVPLVETRVCQYEQTPDADFIIDRHPAIDNVWIVGGGSGHGFKHGPAIGELMAELILKDREPDATFRLERFKQQKALSS